MVSGHLSILTHQETTYIGIATLDGTYNIYDLSKRSLVVIIPHRIGILNVPLGSSFLSNGPFIACAGSYDVSVWDYQRCKRLQVLSDRSNGGPLVL